MKKIFINSIIVAASMLFITGCKKDVEYKAAFQQASPSTSLLKVIYASAYSLNPAVQVSIDDVRVSGLITGRTPFPGGGYNTVGSNFPDYLFVKPGSRKFSIAIPKKGTNVDSLLLFSTQLDLDADKNYTVNIMDTLAKTKSLLVVDTVEIPKAGTVKYRFVNLMPNVPAVDLYYGTTLVASNVAYNSAGKVFSIPVPLLTAWFIRETGTSPTSTALATYSSANTIIDQRMFTAFAMGYKSSTSATLKPYISFAITY